MELDIHKNIVNKLKYFIEIKKIPNIIFHGPSGSGKKKLVNNFINLIYNNDKHLIKSYVMYVNCAHGKGIKFIREELKFFAKTYIINNFFKSIILSNADKLTIDGQSALRRCIELFSHSTRFFIIVEDKYKLLRPIISRFCEIYVHYPIVNGKPTNLNKYQVDNIFDDIKNKNRLIWIKRKIDSIINLKNNLSKEKLFDLSLSFYEKGYSAIDLINIIENLKINDLKKYKILLTIHKIKKEFRNEKLLMLFILNMLLYDIENEINNDMTNDMQVNNNIENISFI